MGSPISLKQFLIANLNRLDLDYDFLLETLEEYLDTLQLKELTGKKTFKYYHIIFYNTTWPMQLRKVNFDWANDNYPEYIEFLEIVSYNDVNYRLGLQYSHPYWKYPSIILQVL